MGIQIEVTGNLTDTPQVRFTSSGKTVANVNLISEDRYRKPDGEWASKNRTVVRVTAWGGVAEYLAEHFGKGDRVKVTGRRIAADAYVNDDGEAAATLDLTADELDDRDPKRFRTSDETE
ncbi:MAG TPA: single-stranded DNA-binding protein [Nocardioidaceae bacterium]